jgi:hypothetical protein
MNDFFNIQKDEQYEGPGVKYRTTIQIVLPKTNNNGTN